MSSTHEIREALKPLIDEVKKKCFCIADDEVSDEDALGLILSKYFNWDGVAILKTAYNALEDANYHTVNLTIERLIFEQEKLYANANRA